MNDTLIHRRVAAARNGTNPAVITRMPAGWAVVGDRPNVAPPPGGEAFAITVPSERPAKGPITPRLSAANP